MNTQSIFFLSTLLVLAPLIAIPSFGMELVQCLGYRGSGRLGSGDENRGSDRLGSDEDYRGSGRITVQGLITPI